MSSFGQTDIFFNNIIYKNILMYHFKKKSPKQGIQFWLKKYTNHKLMFSLYLRSVNIKTEAC